MYLNEVFGLNLLAFLEFEWQTFFVLSFFFFKPVVSVEILDIVLKECCFNFSIKLRESKVRNAALNYVGNMGWNTESTSYLFKFYLTNLTYWILIFLAS